MITKLDFVAVPSRNADRSRAFYVDTLELRPDEQARYEFWAGETCFAIYEPETVGMEFHPQRAAHPALHVDDVDVAQAELESRGVEELEALRTRGGGPRAAVRDARRRGEAPFEQVARGGFFLLASEPLTEDPAAVSARLAGAPESGALAALHGTRRTALRRTATGTHERFAQLLRGARASARTSTCTRTSAASTASRAARSATSRRATRARGRRSTRARCCAPVPGRSAHDP